MPSAETTRGIDYLRNIIESTRTLKLAEPTEVNQGSSFLFEIQAYGKAWRFSLAREHVDDLPHTKEHQSSALSLAVSLASRFKNVDPNIFVTRRNRLLRITLEWPPVQWWSENGTPAAAVGIWALIEDMTTGEVTRCAVLITYQQMMAAFGVDPLRRAEYVVNTLRSKIDKGELRFYTNRDNIPNVAPSLRLQTDSFCDGPVALQDFVTNKVWLLGFQAGNGNRKSSAWVADPWDANYLGCSVSDLRRAAAVADAQQKITLGEDEEFATAGKSLLASNGPTEPPSESKDARHLSPPRRTEVRLTHRPANVLNIFIASPSDVKEERKVVSDAIYDWNAAHFMQTGIMLNPIKWESHSYPASGDRPQALINKQLVESGDILIGIFGYKLGTPTGVAQSGTIEEIEEFRKSGRYVALYFSTADVPRDADRRQLDALEAYKRERQADTLYFDFEDSESLRDHLTRHLPNIVRTVADQLQINNPPQPQANEAPPASAELLKVEKLMPDLLAEMRKDLSENPLCREFIVMSKRLTFVYPDDRVILTYYTEDHPELLGKVRILENYGLVRDIKHNTVPRYAISEKLAEYLTPLHPPQSD